MMCQLVLHWQWLLYNCIQIPFCTYRLMTQDLQAQFNLCGRGPQRKLSFEKLRLYSVVIGKKKHIYTIVLQICLSLCNVSYFFNHSTDWDETWWISSLEHKNVPVLTSKLIPEPACLHEIMMFASNGGLASPAGSNRVWLVEQKQLCHSFST